MTCCYVYIFNQLPEEDGNRGHFHACGRRFHTGYEIIA